MAVGWCYWKASSFMRKDHASVAKPHDENGEVVAEYWLAWPPFIEAGMERFVMKRRFKTAAAAMDFTDKQWPITG